MKSKYSVLTMLDTMRYLLLCYLSVALFACTNDAEEVLPAGKRQVALSFTNTPQTLLGLRIFIFNEQQVLVEEQTFTTYPTSLRSSVGKFYFVFVGNAMNDSDIPSLKTGVTTMSDALHILQSASDGLNYLSPSEYFLYVTPTAIDLNSISSLSVNLKRSVGGLEFSFKPSATIKEVYANIEKPVTAINFNGTTVTTATSGSIRYRLTKNATTGNFEGQMIGFPQTNAVVSYDVIYSSGTSQTYYLGQPINILASKITRIQTQFSGTVSSTINYITWANSYTINYYAGFQVNITVQGGKPANYTSVTVTVKNTSVTPNVTTQYNNIPLVNNNGTLSFNVAQFIGNGSYILTSARLSDRDGALSDPNNLGGALALGFNVPGKAVAFTLDGRQNEEEYYVRKAIVTMHGSLTAGSAYPGTATYATRCVPTNIPTQVEGTEVKQWPVTSPNGNTYAIITRVISGEWRVVAFSFENDTSPFASATADTRFQAGGGKMPITDFYPFLYLETIAYAKIELKYGSDISGFSNVKRLNSLVINNSAVSLANQFSGALPTSLASKDMIRFEVSFTNMVSTLPSIYGNWTNISIMHFIGNSGLTGSIPSTYAYFPRITLLRLFVCNLSGKVPVDFNNYATMNVGINFNSNRLTCMPQAFLDRYTINVTSQQIGTIGACTYP